jgi:hypothetical protein
MVGYPIYYGKYNSCSNHQPDSQPPTSPIGFLFLKLRPPPWAVLLVFNPKIDCRNPEFPTNLAVFFPLQLAGVQAHLVRKWRSGQAKGQGPGVVPWLRMSGKFSKDFVSAQSLRWNHIKTKTINLEKWMKHKK